MGTLSTSKFSRRPAKLTWDPGKNATPSRYWSLASKAILEIDAILLTVKPPGECRVWSKHFGQTYVSNRCSPVSELPVANVSNADQTPPIE